MSYRELRNFTEIMRTLGYPRLISMENFRKPNFELVADILYWMVKQYDPETTISDRVEFENERVEFLTEIASLMASKARLKLNTKKLYSSDGRAVQELLKIATLLYRANTSINKTVDDSPPPPIKVQDVKAARTLASEITQKGAKVFDLLSTESTDRLERLQALRFLDTAGSSLEGSKEHSYIERSVRELIDQAHQAVEDVRKECEELEADEKNIEAKIRKKQEELERTEKRLRSLDNVRPQFMEEQEKLERELQRQYDIYMEKYRNMDYLEHELEQYYKQEEERKKEQDMKLKRMREKLLKEEVEVLRGNREIDDDDDAMIMATKAAPRNAGYNAYGKGQVTGSMTIQSDGESSEGESGDDVSEDDQGSEEEEELSVNSAMGRARGGHGGRSEQDSDDFLDDDEDEEDDDMDGGNDDESGSDEQF